MLLASSIKHARFGSVMFESLWGSGFSSTKCDKEKKFFVEKVRRVWTVTSAGCTQPVSYRDFVVKELSDAIDSDLVSKKTKQVHKKLLQQIEVMPSVEGATKIHLLFNNKISVSDAFDIAVHNSNVGVLGSVSRFTDENEEASQGMVCPATMIAWRAIFKAMGESIYLEDSHFSQSSYSALLMELMKAEQVRALSLSGASFAGQTADESIYQLMRMFRVRKELDLDTTAIAHLSLASMGIGDVGCDSISSAFEDGLLRSVRSLSLHNNTIGNRAAERLCEAVAAPESSMMELDLSLNDLDQVGVRRAHIAALEKVNLDVCLAANNIK